MRGRSTKSCVFSIIPGSIGFKGFTPFVFNNILASITRILLLEVFHHSFDNRSSWPTWISAGRSSSTAQAHNRWRIGSGERLGWSERPSIRTIYRYDNTVKRKSRGSSLRGWSWASPSTYMDTYAHVSPWNAQAALPDEYSALRSTELPFRQARRGGSWHAPLPSYSMPPARRSHCRKAPIASRRCRAW